MYTLIVNGIYNHFINIETRNYAVMAIFFDHPDAKSYPMSDGKTTVIIY